ncbi:MAG: 2-deoxy-5-keto-D-gluconate 6-phosphate aldolase domain-containing protein [bacterium]
MLADLGFKDTLFVMPFDHRGSFMAKMFGIKGRQPTAEETKEIASTKRIVYEGFQQALAQGVPKDKAAILVDEQFGAECVVDALQKGIKAAMPAEKSGQDEFDFEYGEQFGAHIEKFNPTFVKVLVRYNTEDDKELNKRQAVRLARLSEYCHKHKRKFMFELLVPALETQLTRLGGDKKKFDTEVRPGLMEKAIAEMQAAGIEPDVWKLEGLERAEDYKAIVAQARSKGRVHVGMIVLGRGENAEKVNHWLKVGAKVEGVIGFAVGRTVFWDPLVGYREKKHNREQAVAQVAKNYKGLVDVFSQAQAGR